MRQKSEQQGQGYSQKQSLALKLDSTAFNAIFLVVFIQAGEYSTRSTTSASDEHRCGVQCKSFCRQLVHVGDIFQAGDVFLEENLMRFVDLWLTVIYGGCVDSHHFNVTIFDQPTRGVRVYSCEQKHLLVKIYNSSKQERSLWFDKSIALNLSRVSQQDEFRIIGIRYNIHQIIRLVSPLSGSVHQMNGQCFMPSFQKLANSLIHNYPLQTPKPHQCVTKLLRSVRSEKKILCCTLHPVVRRHVAMLTSVQLVAQKCRLRWPK